MRSHPHLSRFPRALTAESYRSASDEIEGLLAELPGLVSVYRTGSVAAPGVSDLDRIAVVERGGSSVPAVWPRLSSATRYAALHAPFLADVDTFRAHRWFAHLAPLELACGEPISLDEPADRTVADLLMAAEGLLTLSLKRLKQAHTCRVKVRSALCELHTLRFSLELGGLDEDAAPVAWAFSRDVQATRQQWFDSQPEGRPAAISGLVARTSGALGDAMLALDRRVRDGSATPEDASARKLHAPWSNVALVACDETTTASALERVFRSPPLSSLSGRSQRLAELRWLATAHSLPVPAAVLGLIVQAREAATEFHHERRRIVAGYGEFLAEDGPAYAAIGLAGAFA